MHSQLLSRRDTLRLCVFLRDKFMQTLMQYLCHEWVISVSPTAGIPPPLWQGGVRWRLEEARKREGSCPKKSPGCLHLFGMSVAVSMATEVKIVGDVSEVRCAAWCWLPDMSCRMNRLHRKRLSIISASTRGRNPLFSCTSCGQDVWFKHTWIRLHYMEQLQPQDVAI